MEFFESQQQDKIYLIIPGKPKPKQGSNSTLIMTEHGLKSRHYTPPDVANYAAYVRFCIAGHRQTPLWDCAIKLCVKISVLRSKAQKLSKHCCVKPDVDNILKNVLDSMAGIIYANDKDICDLHVTKEFSQTPQIEIWAEKMV